MLEREAKVYEALEALGIAYERFVHEAAYTMQDLEELDARIGAQHCKNLFLANTQGYYLLMIGAGKKFVTKQVSPQVPTSRLSFGSEEKLLELLGMSGGAISPMGLINDTGYRVRLLIDDDLKEGSVVVHPNVNTASIVLSLADFYSVFLPHYGYEPQFVSIPGGNE